ncbi:ANTAR domain-containing protein [Knoellia sp. S7-12]|uniref:ANTAR domain-containing protein n=1 Tax=Knoellia sp. S7-12 TaxID=3126698 RepID=UPI0033669513
MALQVCPTFARASLTMVTRGSRPRSLWSSDAVAAQLDAIQFSQRCGPACDVAAKGGWSTATMSDLKSTRGGPALASTADRLGVGSVLSVGLAVFAPALLLLPQWSERHTNGSLTLYASHPGAFTDAAIDTVLTATGHAAMSLTAQARIEAAERTAGDLADQLRVGLESRAVIGRAQGILMERHHITQQEAFDLLRTVSMRRNRKLRDLADELVATIDRGKHADATLDAYDEQAARSASKPQRNR